MRVVVGDKVGDERCGVVQRLNYGIHVAGVAQITEARQSSLHTAVLRLHRHQTLRLEIRQALTTRIRPEMTIMKYW